MLGDTKVDAEGTVVVTESEVLTLEVESKLHLYQI
jgi:hypothetical protein